ncbi:MAG: hypothetical protein KDK99_15350 [Verrucomicrobiales bacterium]|nr:hypothetical protein [Verrucomicrobiales bacterium]
MGNEDLIEMGMGPILERILRAIRTGDNLDEAVAELKRGILSVRPESTAEVDALISRIYMEAQKAK